MSSANPTEYQQLEEMVRRVPGRKLLPERDLSRKLGISRARLRQLLSQLESEGLIHRRQGSGTYAADQGEGMLGEVLLLVDRRLKLGDDPFFSAAAEHLQHALQAEGIRCILHRFESGDLVDGCPDGVITLGLAGRQLLESMARRRGKPTIPAAGLFISDVHPRAGAEVRASLLDLDDVDAGRQAVGWLEQRGVRRVTFIGQNDLPVARARLAGVREAAAEFGMSVHIVETGMNYLAGLEAARKLKVGEDSGIIAVNDWLAVGIRAGLAGSPVAVCSFDGLSIASDPAMRIASFRAPLAEMAADAVAELRRLATSPTAVPRGIRYRFMEPLLP